MKADIDQLRESPRDHTKCEECGRIVGRLPLHLFQMHGLSIEQYYRKYPEARKQEEEPQQNPQDFQEHSINKKLMGLPYGTSIIEKSLATRNLQEVDSNMPVLKIAHKTRTNFNMLVNNVPFSFDTAGVASVPPSHKKERDILAMKPGYYVPEEAKPEVVLEPMEEKPEVVDPFDAVEAGSEEKESGIEEPGSVEKEEASDIEDDTDEYALRRAGLELLDRKGLVKEAKKIGVKANGKSVNIIQRILDEEFEDAEE